MEQGLRRLRNRIALIALLIALPAASMASDEVDASGKIDVKEIAFHHIGDSYSWTILELGHGHDITLPLPVIVWGRDGKVHVFSSSHLENGATYEGFSIAPGGDQKGKLVEATGGRPPLDISITKNVAGLLLACLLLLLLIMPLAGWYRRGKMRAPGGVRGAIEVTIEYMCDEVITPCVGPEYKRYTPYLLTVFFFILINNILGLIPFFPAGVNLTGNITITFVLALSTFLIVNFSGTKEYWKEIFWPDVPTWLKVPLPMMPAIEFVGIFTKPFALMIRLFANIFAGHIVIIGMISVIFITVSMGTATNAAMAVVSVIFGIFMFCMELLVAFIQAYVFTLLSSIFIGMARVKHGEGHSIL